MSYCTCKYLWPIINGECVACGKPLENPSKWIARNFPPVTMDEIADAVNYIKNGPQKEPQ